MQIRVRLERSKDRSYTITIHPGLFRQLPGLLVESSRRKRLFIITDSTVARLYGSSLFGELKRRGCDAILLAVPPGERSKSPQMLLRLQSRLLDERVNRDSLVVALGGGVIGDLAGFVAATVLRGIQFVQVPTTLLAQVDSSVGGKVGVDHRLGKNMIGAFHQPLAVFIDPVLLKTLPEVEYRNGIAEIVKIAAGLDRRFFSYLEKNVRQIKKRDVRVVSSLIGRAVGLKAAVVSKDEFEQGLRKVLNFGHTIGHALEAATGYSIKHGMGVSMGMATEARLATRLGIMKESECARLTSLLSDLGLPVQSPRGVNARTFASALALDKKSDAIGTTFVLPSRIGKCVIGARVSQSVLRKEMDSSLAVMSR